MWKKNDGPVQNPAAPPAPAAQPHPAPVAAVTPSVAAAERPRSAAASAAVTIGASVVIKGEVSAREDLTIGGRIEGKVEVLDHVVRVGREAQVHAAISARAVLVEGTVKGNITATERIELLEHGNVEGDIAAPKVAMAEGAQFRGKIDMAKRADGIRKSA
ncbi:MAG TPA: polymer-forming cytoskeletal protein [Vicinamibacterales bacterium]|nr:polymer-forming cytoskeletal protein [Vicinamibacterales bacterium]